MDKKDYKYIIGFLIMIIVVVVVFFYGSEKNEIVSYFGFAATLSSLLLSVAALIYTFFQTTTSVNQTQKLTETSDKLNQTSEALNEAVQDFKQTQTQLVEVAQVVQGVDTKFTQVGERVESIWMSVSTLSPIQDVSQDQSSFSSFSDDELKAVLKNTSLSGAIALALCCYQIFVPKPKLLHHLLPEAEEVMIDFQAEYAFGYLVGFSSSKVISINNDDIQSIIRTHDPHQFLKILKEVLMEMSTYSPYNQQSISTRLLELKKFYEDKDIGLTL